MRYRSKYSLGLPHTQYLTCMTIKQTKKSIDVFAQFAATLVWFLHFFSSSNYKVLFFAFLSIVFNKLCFAVLGSCVIQYCHCGWIKSERRAP